MAVAIHLLLTVRSKYGLLRNWVNHRFAVFLRVAGIVDVRNIDCLTALQSDEK